VKRESGARELNEIGKSRPLSKPARAGLSVVIGLDVGGSTTLDIVRCEFTD
jgi:hypothetical protein